MMRPEVTSATSGDFAEREYRRNDAGTLEHLLDLREDAATGSRLAAELFDHTDPDLATYFRGLATYNDDAAERLAVLAVQAGLDGDAESTGTFYGRLLRWQLRIAKYRVVGDTPKQDRRAILSIIRRGSQFILDTLIDAERRLSNAEAVEEVREQVQATLVTDAYIQRLYDDTR
jgi:hypothetical protein